MDTTGDRCRDEIISARCFARAAVQIRARHSRNARNRRALGNSSVDSNTRRILCGWNWPPCYRAIVRRDGRARRELARRLSATASVLFPDGVRQLLSVVNQTAFAFQTALERSGQDRQLPSRRYDNHLHHLFVDQNEAAALYPAGFSI